MLPAGQDCSFHQQPRDKCKPIDDRLAEHEAGVRRAIGVLLSWSCPRGHSPRCTAWLRMAPWSPPCDACALSRLPTLQVTTAAAQLAQLPVALTSESRSDLFSVADCSIQSALLAGRGISADDASAMLAVLRGTTASTAAEADEASWQPGGISTGVAGRSLLQADAATAAMAANVRFAVQGVTELMLVTASPATEGGYLAAGDDGMYAAAAGLPGSWYVDATLIAGIGRDHASVMFFDELAGRCSQDGIRSVACPSGFVSAGVSYIEQAAGHVSQSPAASRRLHEEAQVQGLQLLTGVVELSVSVAGGGEKRCTCWGAH